MNSFKNTDNILIIGGTGFIGRHLTEKCLSSTSNVVCIGLAQKDPFKGRAEVLRADIGNREQLQSILRNRVFHYVFNLGGYIDHTHYFKGGRKVIETHLSGLMNLVDCLDTERLHGFVQVGSSDEYGAQPAPQKETMREMPIAPYSFAKAAATHFIQTLAGTEGFPGVVLRPFLVYGPGQDEKRFLPQVIRGCLADEEFKTSEGRQLRDFCYIDDVVEAMVRAALLPSVKGRVVNVGSGTPVSIREVIRKAVELAGGGRPLWGAHPYRKGENMELYADVTLAKSLLSWEAVTGLDEGLKRTIEYYKRISK